LLNTALFFRTVVLDAHLSCCIPRNPQWHSAPHGTQRVTNAASH